MQKLLIAESTEAFCTALQKTLCSKFDIRICTQSTAVLHHIRTFQPDIMVLDMMMPGLDGVSILQAAYTAGFRSKVLAILRQTTGYCEQKLVKYGVQYIMVKPCYVPVVAARVADIAQQMSGEVDIFSEVDHMLLLMGCQSGLTGYLCLCDAVLMKMQDPDCMFTKEIYPQLAAKYAKTSVGIERLIRTVVEDAFKRRDDAVWRLYFPAERNGSLVCPPNKLFITKMAACLAGELENCVQR